MKTTTLRILLIAVVAALALMMAGCKGESSPTAPPSTSTVPPGGGVTPPTGAVVTLTVSNPNPLVSSRVTVTATVTVGGSPVTDGTAVQFTVSPLGTFTDTGQNSTIRTTTGGVATATFSSASPGVTTVTATVNNVSKNVSVTFGTAPVTPPVPSTAPTIASVAPAIGLPTGGQTVTITGTNFRQPVRVLFDPGNGQAAKEGFVASVTATQITVVSPAFDIVTGQTLPVTITVIDEAGTTNEQKVSAANAFTYQLAVLTPSVRNVTPSSGPIDGGTRVTINGDAFQAPVQVFFGAAEAQVITVQFSQIIVMSPTARDTAPNASGSVTGPVDIKIVNVASGKTVTFPAGFRYVAKAQVTAAGPTEGPFTGGTRVSIDGTGFNDPLTVTFAGVAAQVIKVSGTEIIAITSPVNVTSCANVTGPIVVTNIDNGDSATGPTWIYDIIKPQIVSIGTGTVNGTTTVTVANAIGIPRIQIGDSVAFIVGSVINPDGTTTFTVQIPPSLKLDTTTCAAGGTAKISTAFDVIYTSLTTTCTDKAPKGLVVSPPSGPILTVAGSFTPFLGTITPATVGPPATPATVSVSPASETVSIIDTGNGTPLIVNSVTPTNAGGVNGCSAFNITVTPPAPANLNQCEAMSISASYKGQTTPTSSADQCTIAVSTNAGNKSFTVSGSSQ